MIQRLMTGVLALACAGAAMAGPAGVTAAAVYRPKGDPAALVLFLSGDGGWTSGVVGMAERLATEGAVVVGVDTPALLKALDAAAGDGCGDLSGALTAFAAQERADLHVAAAAPLVLAGYSSGATAIYVAQATMVANTVGGSLALGFCPDLDTRRPFCASGGAATVAATRTKQGYVYSAAEPSLKGFIALQGLIDQVCDADATIAFVGRIPGARVVPLPKVGHGFSVEKNWMPQFLAAYHDLAGAKP